MNLEDETLVQLWAEEKITFEGAIHRAHSKNDVRLGIKLRKEFWSRPDKDSPPFAAGSESDI